MKKKLVAMILALAMLASLAACGAKAEAPAADAPVAEAPATEAEQLHFVFVTPLVTTGGGWHTSQVGFETACEELGIRGDYIGPTNISPEDMAKMIETSVAQDVDAIITQGLVTEEPVEAAIAAGIPVLIVDSDLSGIENRFAYLGKDAVYQAECVRKAVDAQLDPSTPIYCGVQAASWSYEVAHDQLEALKEAFADWPGGFEVVAQSECNGDKLTGTNEWKNVLTAYPEINLCMSFGAVGVYSCANAAKELGLNLDDILMYGVDDEAETLDKIETGEVDGTVAVSFWNYGYQAAYWLYAHVTEGKVPAQKINNPGMVMITKDNLNNYADEMNVTTFLD